jgi:RHS repeat-associated protein
MVVYPDRASTGTTRDIIDPSGKLLIRIKPSGAKTYHIYGLGLLYEIDDAAIPKTKTYHFDQVGSTLVRIDDSGKIIGQAEYSAYGLLTWKSGDMATPFLYNGQAGVQTDPNGLLNMRARYYSPYLCRFLNADPSGFSGGSNWFAYADGNPISKSDPFGLDAVFLYGPNSLNPNYFRGHAEAQAAQFEAKHKPVTGYSSNLYMPGNPAVTAQFGEPTEKAYVFSAESPGAWNTALNSVSDISNVTYNGHSHDLPNANQLPSVERGNLKNNATICLNGCSTGIDNNNSGTFSAQRFADHFGVPTRGVTEDLSYGLPVVGGFAGSMRGAGTIRQPNFMWAQPNNQSATSSNNK